MKFLMRRIFLASTIFAFFFSSFAPFSIPAVWAADEVCWVLELQYYNDMAYTATTTAEIIHVSPFRIYGQGSLTLSPGETGTLRVSALVPASDTDVTFSSTIVFAYLGGAGLYQANASACNSGAAEIADGRVNGRDLAAPVVGYCHDGGMAVWDIDAEGHGAYAFDVSADDISAALDQAVASQQNILIAESLGNRFYALQSNELALIGIEPGSGKQYQHIMPPDACGS